MATAFLTKTMDGAQIMKAKAHAQLIDFESICNPKQLSTVTVTNELHTIVIKLAKSIRFQKEASTDGLYKAKNIH